MLRTTVSDYSQVSSYTVSNYRVSYYSVSDTGKYQSR